jgi:hypothetical protein
LNAGIVNVGSNRHSIASRQPVGPTAHIFCEYVLENVTNGNLI